MKRSLSVSVTLLSVSIWSCAAEEYGEPRPEIGVVSSQIINGTVTWERPEVGLVWYTPPPPMPQEKCSGTLVGSRFFLTAAHCVHFEESHPERYSVEFAPNAQQALFWNVVHVFNLGPVSTPQDPFPNDHFLGDFSWLNRKKTISPNGDGNNDLAVLMLDGAPPFTPATVNTMSVPSGYLVTAFGYGPFDTAGNADDKKRWRSWSYNRATGGQQQPAGGRVLGSGDSGGPAFFAGLGDGGPLWGVASGSNGTLDSWGDAVYWRPGIMYALDTGRNTRWFDAPSEEVAATGWPMQDVEMTSWHQANRAAIGYCGKMTYAGGLLNGWQSWTAFGTYCLGKAVLFNITQAQRDTSPSTFSDVATVGWAQAARVADTLCRQFGYVSGQFNGHQNSSHVMGLTCYAADAQWFDVPRGYGASVGWPIDTLETVGWARAARVADKWCTDPARGFVGGRFNGWASSTNFGVICVR